MKISDLPQRLPTTLGELALNVAHIADELSSMNDYLARIAFALEARAKESERSPGCE